MGRGFGNLGCRVNGLIYYSISPFEQRAFAGFFKKSIPNTIRRCKEFLIPAFVPTIAFLAIYNYAENKHAAMIRKNPKDFEHEV